jgi:hypothetical protein
MSQLYAKAVPQPQIVCSDRYGQLRLKTSIVIRTLSVIFLASILIIGCKKECEMGEVLFCTNSAIINCPFSIELSIDDIVVEIVTAASNYTSSECTCSDSFSIGILIDLEAGEHTYYGKELNCQGSNGINEWSGSFVITENRCQIVNLNVLE